MPRESAQVCCIYSLSQSVTHSLTLTGDAGYIPLLKEAPKSFADFQKEQAAKKAAGK